MTRAHIARLPHTARLPRATLLASACLLVLAAVPAAAQQRPAPQNQDRTALASCLRERTGDPRACIGAVAVPCTQQASGDASAELACARRERALWRDRLDTAVQALGPRLDTAARARFAALQRQWEGYAAQNCAFLGDLAPPARAAATQTACDLREVALRAIDLEKMARRASRPPASNPPRIER